MKSSHLKLSIEHHFVDIQNADLLMRLCGIHHRHLHILEQHLEGFSLRTESQGGGIALTGTSDGVRQARKILAAFLKHLQHDPDAGETEFKSIMRHFVETDNHDLTLRGLRKTIMPQTSGQINYLKILQDGSINLVFGVGPAGTGKTFLAVTVGAAGLIKGEYDRLIVARPAVEAGERLGFLPGDLEEKVDPYMLPIWDALREFLGQEQIEKRKARGEIEVAPLAFMRGRTLKNAFIIIDEAQNATTAQMKMVLTRLGQNSRMVVTGDPSQLDLPNRQQSGLIHALAVLKDIPSIKQMYLTNADVVRHDLVATIIDAYARYESQYNDG